MTALPLNGNDNLIAEQYRELQSSFRLALREKEERLIHKAFMFMVDVHKDLRKETGEPYFYHAVSVAKIVAAEFGLGYISVVSSLLQDVLIDTSITTEQIRKEFGEIVANIVNGLTTIAKLQTDKISFHSENFLRLLLTLSGDTRVIMIKLADRLHFMRILDELTASDKSRISAETMNLYAPIAHRLGLYNIKSELEELSMHFTEPAIYHSIERKLEELKERQDLFIKEFTKPIKIELIKEGLRFEIKGRTKAIFSIWQKMKKQNVEFEEVYDLFAIRIILESEGEREKTDCWKAYSVVTNLYQPNPKRLRDWITTPKENGYESLQTTVLASQNRWVEVQIRSRRMDNNAEKGHAAHWLYKGVKDGTENTQWLDNVRSILEKPHAMESREYEKLKIQLADDSIFVFTPQGDLKKLPQGATVLDFAYEVHTGLGEKCSGARVNGIQVPIKHVLKNGDKVEISSSKNQKPNLDWLNWVKTTRARNKIKRFLRVAEFNRSDEGREMLRRKLNQMDLVLNDLVLNKLKQHYKLSEPLELYHLIAEGKIEVSEIKDILLAPVRMLDESLKEKIQKKISQATGSDFGGGAFLLIDNNPDISDYKLAKCCQPLAGDDIFGFVTVGEGIKIHRSSCPNAIQMRSRYHYRVVSAKWVKKEEVTSFIADIRITGDDRLGIANDITHAISQDMKVNMRSISIESRLGKFEGHIRVVVMESKNLESLLHRLAKISGVRKATRVQT